MCVSISKPIRICCMHRMVAAHKEMCESGVLHPRETSPLAARDD